MAKIRIGAVEGAQCQLHQADFIQQKNEDEAFRDRGLVTGPRLARDRVHLAQFLVKDILDGFGFAETRNAGSGFCQETLDGCVRRSEQDQMLGHPAGIHPIQIMLALLYARYATVSGHPLRL